MRSEEIKTAGEVLHHTQTEPRNRKMTSCLSHLQTLTSSLWILMILTCLFKLTYVRMINVDLFPC